MRFPVILHSDDGVRFGVTVADLPGCFSAGDTLDEALDSVVEAMALHLEGLTEERVDIPVSCSLAEQRANPDFASCVRAAVEIDVSRFERRAEKINITLPLRFLAEAARAVIR